MYKVGLGRVLLLKRVALGVIRRASSRADTVPAGSGLPESNPVGRTQQWWLGS